jgi:sigma-B regulation protein RsbU (phosphoserine phosphatase)
MYFTIWYGVYDTASLTVTYAAAGHHPAVLLAPDAAPRLLQGKGLPIGCFANVNYPVFSVSTPPGSRLYVFSDGIFEVELNNTEDMFTFEEFVNIIMEWRENHTDRDIMFLLETVQQIQGRSNFDDDCALVEIEFCQARKLVLVA